MMFYWDEWNREHATVHGVSHAESMSVVRNAAPPYPQSVGQGKYLVRGPTPRGRLIQVILTYTSPEKMDYEQLTLDDILDLESEPGPFVYIIHARDLTQSEKRGYTKRRRQPEQSWQKEKPGRAFSRCPARKRRRP